MIKKFDRFNESIVDKMKPKDLGPDLELFMKLYNDIQEIYDIQTFEIRSSNGQHKFEFWEERIGAKEYFRLTLHYNDEEKMKELYTPEAMSKMTTGWFIVEVIDDHTKTSNRTEFEIKTPTYDNIIKSMLTHVYEDIDSVEETKRNEIATLEQQIKWNTQQLNTILKIKKIIS